jgi:hypothetical protein
MSHPKKTKAQKPLTRGAKRAPSAKAAPAAKTSSVRAPRARMAAADPDEDAGKAARKRAAEAKAAAAPAERRRPGRKVAAARAKAPAKGEAKVASKKAAASRKPKSAAVRTAPDVAKPVEAAAKPRAPRAVRGRSDDAPPVAAAPARAAKPRRKAPVAPAAAVSVPPAEAVKYGNGTALPRQFEEERFLFPRNYEINRVRVVVRDPEWLFAYWDVNPRAFDAIRSELGERVMALSRLTLKIVDPESSASEVILLPYGARSWYLRIDATRRSVLAELGITLPNGQFRTLARSNAARVPRSGPSSEAATQSVRYDQAWAASGILGIPTEDVIAAGLPAGVGATESRTIRAGASELLVAELRQRLAPEGPGASDVFRH